jgi:hypothetical protein
MKVVECDVPSGSMLSRELIERAYFRDSFRASLSRTDIGVTDIFLAIFSHHPLWMKLLLIVRNRAASLVGLDAPTASEILDADIKDRYVVREKIGVWPIFSLSEDEVVAGRNNKHLDFRVSVLKRSDGDGSSVVVSTVCTVHNLSGRLYLFFVVPFHRYGVSEADGERARRAKVVTRLRRAASDQKSTPTATVLLSFVSWVPSVRFHPLTALTMDIYHIWFNLKDGAATQRSPAPISTI